MSPWVKKVFLEFMPRILCMKRPEYHPRYAFEGEFNAFTAAENNEFGMNFGTRYDTWKFLILLWYYELLNSWALRINILFSLSNIKIWEERKLLRQQSSNRVKFGSFKAHEIFLRWHWRYIGVSIFNLIQFHIFFIYL